LACIGLEITDDQLDRNTTTHNIVETAAEYRLAARQLDKQRVVLVIEGRFYIIPIIAKDEDLRVMLLVKTPFNFTRDNIEFGYSSISINRIIQRKKSTGYGVFNAECGGCLWHVSADWCVIS
jgi:hypothetical protein